MTITQHRYPRALAIAPVGRVDSTTSGTLEDALDSALRAGERRLVIDLAGVEYISSAGLRVLLVLARRLRESQGSLVLCAMAEPVRQVFELAGFLPLFVVEPSRDAAVARLSPPDPGAR
jgi:anti-anti-sigma factor